jgi:hypothetical protein
VETHSHFVLMRTVTYTGVKTMAYRFPPKQSQPYQEGDRGTVGGSEVIAEGAKADRAQRQQ